MFRSACAATGNHRDDYSITDRTGQRYIVALFCAVAIHRGKQDLARTTAFDFVRPCHGIEPGIDAPA